MEVERGRRGIDGGEVVEGRSRGVKSRLMGDRRGSEFFEGRSERGRRGIDGGKVVEGQLRG